MNTVGFLHRKGANVVFRLPSKIADGSILIDVACVLESDAFGDTVTVPFNFEKEQHALQLANSRWNDASCVVRESPDFWRVEAES